MSFFPAANFPGPSAAARGRDLKHLGAGGPSWQALGCARVQPGPPGAGSWCPALACGLGPAAMGRGACSPLAPGLALNPRSGLRCPRTCSSRQRTCVPIEGVRVCVHAQKPSLSPWETLRSTGAARSPKRRGQGLLYSVGRPWVALPEPGLGGLYLAAACPHRPSVSLRSSCKRACAKAHQVAPSVAGSNQATERWQWWEGALGPPALDGVRLRLGTRQEGWGTGGQRHEQGRQPLTQDPGQAARQDPGWVSAKKGASEGVAAAKRARQGCWG